MSSNLCNQAPLFTELHLLQGTEISAQSHAHLRVFFPKKPQSSQTPNLMVWKIRYIDIQKERISTLFTMFEHWEKEACSLLAAQKHCFVCFHQPVLCRVCEFILWTSCLVTNIQIKKLKLNINIAVVSKCVCHLKAHYLLVQSPNMIV